MVTLPPGYSITTVTIVGVEPTKGLAPGYDRPFAIKAKHVGTVVKAA